MSWRQYGGTQKTTISTVNAGSIVANQFLSRSTAANINQFDNLKVKGQLLSQDFIQSGTYIQALGELITSGNLFVKDRLFFGTDASRVNLPWTYVTGNPNGISINNQHPEAALHITGLSFEVLKIDTSMNYIRNIIGQNVNAHGIVIAADDASSNIYFYNDVSTNILNKADSFIKNQPGSGLTIGSSSASVISLDNRGNVLISAAGTLSLFSTTGNFNISSNSTTLDSYLIVTNRGLNYDGKYKESAIIYDSSNTTYLKNVYDVSSALTGNSLSLLAIDNSSNTYLRIIDPSGSGFAVGGGAFPADTKRSFGSLFLSDFSGNYVLSQNIVSGNTFHKYASTTGINTFIPKTDKYVLDINGPTRIGNGELKTVFNANFEFKQVHFSKINPNFGMAVGSSSSTGTLVGNNIVYLQYFSFTNDKGKTWNTLPIDIDVNSYDNFEQRSDNIFNSLYVYDTSFAILGTNNSSLYYTINGGLNWALLIYNSIETSSLVFRNTTNIYVTPYLDIFRVFLSFDYTNNTNNTANSPKYNTFYFTFNPYNPVDPIVYSGYIGYLTSNQSYNIQNYFTYSINPVTNAITYTNIGTNNYSYKVNAVDCSGRYIYLAGDGIIKVDMSNSIPTSIYNRQNVYLSQYNGVNVYDNSNAIAVGNNILSWTNDGTTWTDLSLSAINIGNVNLQSVFIYDLSRAVAVGNNGVFIYTNNWQSSRWSIVPHELLNSSGIGSRIDGSNNQLRNIYMHSIDLFLISNVTSSYVPNTYSGTTITSTGSYGASRLLYAYYPNLYNRVSNTVFEVSGNMFMSGDLNINDGGKLMSNNSSFNLLNNNNIQSIYIGNDETINNMAGSLFVGYDLSVNSRMFVVNDVSMNSRLFVGADVSMNGNVYSGGRSIIKGDVSMNSRLFIKGDVSMNSRLFVTSDVSFGSRLFVGGDASLNSRLFVTSDVSFGSRLFVGGDVSMNSRLFVTSDVSMGARLFVNGDVSMNSKLSIGSDTYVGGNFTVQKDVLIVGRLNVLEYAESSIIYTNVTTNNYTLIISEDLSLNGRLVVNDDGFIRSRLFIGGDVSMNGNVYSFGRTIKQGDVSMNSRLFVNGDVSMNSRLFVTSDVSMGARLFVLSDSSFGGNIYTIGRTINQGDVSMNSRLFVNGDVSMNSRLFVTSDVSMGSRLFVKTDVSFGSNLYAQGRTILQGDVSMNSRLFVNGDVSMNSRLFVTSDVSMNARLFVSNDVSFGSNLYAQGRTIIKGDVSMNSRLFINGDVSMNSRLFVSSDVSMNARLFVSNDVSFNGNLYTNFRSILNGDAVLNNRLFVVNDVSLNSNVGITKNLTVYSTVYSAYYDICSNLYYNNPNYPDVATEPGVADSITIGNSAKFINIGTGQGTVGSTRTITIGAGNQTSSSTTNTIYLAGANDNLIISGKLSAQNFNLTTIAIPAFVFNSTQNNTTGTAAATNYGSSFSKIKANASSISSVANIADNVGWLGAGFAIQDASLSTAGFFTVDSSGTGFYMKAPASNNIVQMYTDSLTYGATNFGNRSNIRNGILVLTTDFSLNSGINGSPLVPYSITVKPIDISNIFLRDDLVTDPSFQRVLTSVCITGDVSMNSRLFVFTDASFTGNMYALGRSIIQGDVSMNSRLFINGDVSMNSRLFVTSDVSMGGRLFVLTDTSFGGNMYTSGRSIIQGDVSMNSRLFINGDVSMNSRLFITSDVSLGGRLFVGGDVSLNSRLFITSDVSLGGRLFVGGDVSLNSRLFITSDVSLGGRLFVGGDVSFNSRLFITSDVSLGGRLFVGGDVSFNSRLFVTSDVSMNARLFVSGDASYNGNLYTLGRTINQGDVSMNSRLFINGDVSMNSRLFVSSDVSMGARLFVGGDVSLNSRLFVSSDVSMNARLFVSGDSSYNGNLYTLGRTIEQGDVSMNSRLFINGDVSMNSRLFVTSDVSMGGRLFVGNDVFINGRLNVLEYRQDYIFYTNVTQTQYTMIVYEDLSLNGRLNVIYDACLNARLFVSNDVSFGSNIYVLGRTINQGDVSMNSRFFINGDVSMNSRLFVTSDVSMGARLFVLTDSSFGGNMYAFGRTINQGDVSMNSRLFVNGDVSMNSRLFVTSDVSMGARLFVLTDSSFGGNIYVSGRTIQQGDVSMNSRLFVNGDVSMNSRLFVTSDVSMGARLFVKTDASFGGNVYGFGRSILQGDVSMNSRLFVKGDVSMNSRLFVTSDVSMGGRLFVGGDVSMNSRLFVTSDVSMGARLFVLTDASFGGNMYIANNLFLGVSGNPYQVDLSGVINLRGTVNPITLIDNSVLLTNTPPLDFSNNYGSAWTPIYGISGETLNSISISSNGQYQTVVTTNSDSLGYIYTSANYGFSWTKNTNISGKYWSSVSVSATGQYQTATVIPGNIWTNSNYGLGPWTEYTIGVNNYIATTSTNGSTSYSLSTQQSTQYWTSVTMSSTGQYQIATINNYYATSGSKSGDLYLTSNYGSSWAIASSLDSGGNTGNTGLPGYKPFNGIAISSTGQYQVTCIYSNNLYISNNFGKTWISILIGATTQQFAGVSISSSGKYISTVTSTINLITNAATTFMGSNRGTIYSSSNYGLTWNDSAINNYWNGISMSANGQYQTAVVNNNAITYSGLFNIVLGSNLVSTRNTSSYPAIILGAAVSGTGIPTGTVVTSNPVLAMGDTVYQFEISNYITQTISNASLTFQSGAIYSSSNYGATWYDSTIKNTKRISNTMNQIWQSQGIAMSANGQYQTVIAGGVGGYIYTSITPYQQVLISNNLTVMSGDTTIYTRLFVINDVSMTSRLFVTSDVSLNARLFVGGDASYNGNLYVSGNVGIGTTTPQTILDVSGIINTTAAGSLNVFQKYIFYNPPRYNGFFTGPGDGANNNVFNTTVASWFGIGFMDTCFKTCRINMNVRQGTLNTVGQNITSLTSATYTPLLSTNLTTSSWTNSGVSWTSAHSSFFNNDVNYSAYNAFTTNAANLKWASIAGSYSAGLPAGSYPTTSVTLSSSSTPDVLTVSGDWIQIQSNVALNVGNYKLSSSDANGLGSAMPKTWWLVGSTNSGTTWFPIHYCSVSAQYVNGQYTDSNTINGNGTGTISFGPVTSNISFTTYGYQYNTFTYFRLIVSSTFGGSNIVDIGRWKLNFSRPTTTALFLDGTTLNQLNVTGGLTTTGNVGIGTTNPTHALTVASDASINSLIVGRGGGSIASNTAFGLNALNANSTGIYNTAIGQGSLQLNTSSYNTGIGHWTLTSNTTGSQNTALGDAALQYNTTGSQNTATGQYALQNNTTGNYNTATGVAALVTNTTGSNNTANGQNALQYNTTGVQNTASGQNSLQSNTTGNYNTANGQGALQSNTTGTYNTATGQIALYLNTTGSQNTANGQGALQNNTTGSNNTANGQGALTSNTTGPNNTANGQGALTSNTTGYNNTANGQGALQNNTTGDSNTAIGLSALQSNITTYQNTAIGYQAGLNNKQTASHWNTFLGSMADLDSSANSWANSTAIGAGAKITASNQITLGTASEKLFLPGGYINTADNSVTTIDTLTIPNYGLSWQNNSAFVTGIGPVGFLSGYGGLRFQTQGANRMNITAAGNVGIGTTTPPSRLTIKNNYTDGIGGGLCINADDPAVYRLYLYSYSPGANQVGYQFQVNNGGTTSNSLAIGYNGYVGIGTNSPSGQLHLYSTLPRTTSSFPTFGHLIVDCSRNGAMGGSITVRNSGGAATANSAASIAFELDGSTAYNNDGTDSANARIACINEGGATNPGALAFNTWNGSANGERMRISSSGNVSILATTVSTSTASGALTLSGTNAGLGVAGNVYAGLVYTPLLNSTAIELGAYASSSTVYIDFKNDVSADYNARIQLTGGSSATLSGTLRYIAGLHSFTDGNLTIGVNNASTSTTTGSLQVTGGAGITGNVYVGGVLNAGASTLSSLTVNGDSTFSGKAYINDNTSSSGSRPSKGFYVWTDAAFGMELQNQNGTWNTAFITRSADGGFAFKKVDGTQFMYINNAGVVSILATTASTGTGSGALIVAGGVGVAGNIYAGKVFSNGYECYTSNNLTIGSYAPLSGATFTGDVRVNTKLYIGIDNPGGGGGDTAYLEYVQISSENTTLRIVSANDAGDNINLMPGFRDTVSGCLGNVGICKDSPTYKLDVNGNVNATSYNATSDIRIKKNIININGTFAVDVLRKLEPKKYSFIDTNKENEYTWGFIGQEIANVFDYATTQTKEYIPNIYDYADISNNKIIKLKSKLTTDFLLKSLTDTSFCKVRLFTSNKKKEIIRTIDKIIDDKTFSITEPILDSDLSGNSLFVYGQYVDDFYSVNYTSVFTITTAAVKEIDRELQAALLVIEEQNKKIQNLTDEMNELKAMVKTLMK